MDFLDGLRSLAALNIMSSQLRFLAVRAAVHVCVECSHLSFLVKVPQGGGK